MLGRMHVREIRVDEESAMADFDMLPRILLIPIIHTWRNQPCTRKHSKTSLAFVIVSWQQSVEFTLDPFRVDVVGEEV